MKKLTWALLSLMLFLGLGVAFAQDDEGGGEAPTVTVPAPTFTPADGAEVTPGDMIMFDVSHEAMMTYQMIVFAYAFDETSDLQPSFMEVYQAMMALLGGEDADEEADEEADGDAGLDCNIAVYNSGQWVPYEGIPTDAAAGSLKMRVRMAYAVEDPENAEAMPTLVYSDEVEATYTVVAATPAPTPSFNPATGATMAYGETVAVSIAEEEESDDYKIYYVIDQPDFDFSTYTLDKDIENVGAKIVTSGSGIKLTKSCTIKAATCKFTMATEGNKLSAWSTPVSASYTVGAPQKPTFDPEAGEVVSGTKVAITSADNPNGAIVVNIYYTTDGTTPTAANTKYTEPIEITAAMTIKAIAIDAKDNTIVSEPAEASYTIKAAITMPTPTISVESGAVVANTEILFDYEGGDEAGGDQEYAIYYVTDADFNFAQYTTPAAVEDAGAEWSESYRVTAAVTIKVAVALIDYSEDNDGKIIAWSEEATATYTIGTPALIAAPTFTPESGSKVAPGQEVTFNVPTAYQNYMIYLLYTTDATAFANATTYDAKMELVEEVTATDDEGDPTYTGPVMTAFYMNGRWVTPCEIPSDAEEGALTLQAFMVIQESQTISETATANYTVEKSEDPVVEEIPEPTFDPAAGVVAKGTTVNINCEESPDGTYTYMIYRVLNNEDFDFTQYVNEDDARLVKAGASYMANYKVNATTTITAATAKVDAMTEEIIAWSKKVSATYTVEAAPSNVPAPTFNPNGGAVVSGTKVILTNGTESEATPKSIYYNFKQTGSEEFDKVTTKAQLESALKPGLAGTSPKLMLYTEGIELTAAKTINAATAEIDADDNVIWSTVITKEFTIKSGDEPTPSAKPEAPTFNPDGGEVEANEKITIATVTSGAKIYYIDGTTASFVNFTTKDKLDEAMDGLIQTVIEYAEYDKPSLSEFQKTTPGDKCSISAAAALIAADGALTWSDVTTKEFTVKASGEQVSVAIPVISPANDATVHMGDMVTITCDTKEAEIYYTTNGTAPFTMDKDGYPVAVREGDDVFKYEEPFALTESMLVKQGKVYSLRIRAVATKGNAISENGGSAGYVVYPNAPTFNPVAGAVEEGTKVAITCVPTFADIYYTIDGTTPTEEDSPKYTEPIEVTAAMTIKAVVVLGQYQTTGSAAYTIKGEEPTPTKPEAPTFSPASGATVDFGAELTISCATEDAMIYYTTNGEDPDPDKENGEYYSSWFGAQITAPVIKAISFIYVGEDDILKSDVATANYTINPIEATLSLVPMKEDTVGKNVGTGVEFSIDGWEEYPATVYYTVDGSTVPSKEAYEAQGADGAIKKLVVEWEEYEAYGDTYRNIVTTDGHFLAITFAEATRLKAIGYITLAGQNVVTPVLDTMLQVRSADKPTFSLAAGKVIKAGDTLVIKNPAVLPEEPDVEAPEDWDDEEGWAAYEEAWNAYNAAIAAAPKIYYSFDGTLPTSAAYGRNPMDKYEEWSVFKVDEGEDVTILFKEDENGLFAHVPSIMGSFPTAADTIRIANGKCFVQALAVATEQGEGGGPTPLAAKAPGASSFMYASDFVATTLYTAPVTLTFNPASGSEVDENTAVAITCSDATAEIFYMMFESEAAAKAAEWNQEEALSYSGELQPVLTKEKNTIKAAYAPKGAEAVSGTFFYATYKVKELPAITLTFNPASGSEVENNTTVTVTANREVEIYYNLYADKAAADADTTFMGKAKEVEEDGMPVITKGNTYLRCAVTDRGEMKYFDATYTIKVANEEIELAGVSVYPNPSNGMFNLELPVAATVEVFASNGVLVQRMKLGEGSATLNIERSGIYFLRITGEGRTTVKRLIVR